MVKGSAGKKVVKDARGGGNKRMFYIALGVLAVAGIAFLSYQTMRPKAPTSFVLDSAIVMVPNQGHVIGSDSAPVEVIEFGDFECPACGNFATLTKPDVVTRLVNTGQIRFRFMDFPLQMHPNAPAAHLAAWCAGEQNKFWEMHDALFAVQDRWSGYATRRPNRVFAELARGIGVNMDQYEACVSSNKYAGQIQANVDEAIKRQVSGTPTFFIGRTRVSEPLSYDEFKRYVDQALAQARAAAPAAPVTKTPATKTRTQ
jgi:protein-disulfide isomerase